MIIQALAAEHIKDMHARAALTRLGAEASRAKRASTSKESSRNSGVFLADT
jgi:hypothetical protein